LRKSCLKNFTSNFPDLKMPFVAGVGNSLPSPQTSIKQIAGLAEDTERVNYLHQKKGQLEDLAALSDKT
jgi:hypothetical protein